MSQGDKLNIKVSIADELYPLSIDPKEEEVIRAAARHINDKLNVYRKTFPNLSTENYLAMVLLHEGVMYKEEEKRNDTKPYQDKLNELTALLDNYIASNEADV